MAVRLPMPNEAIYQIELPVGDEKQIATVGFRQATVGEQEALAELDATVMNEFDQNGFLVRQSSHSNWFTVRRMQVYLTMTKCDITRFNDDDDAEEQLFKFRRIDGKNRVDMDEGAFNKAYGALPQVWVAKIIEKMLEINPQWRVQIREKTGE